jgi:hypothetical protein
MRGSTPPLSVWLMNSKLKAWIIASRTRQSAKDVAAGVHHEAR